ncbi:MAG: crossover junction endodeoxyribonuclease RuvC, partial [Algiphilus sp.]
MRILGVDPGSRVTGYGVVEAQGQNLRCVAAGVIRPPRLQPAGRLGHIHAALTTLIQTHGPTILAIERVFIAKNAASALMLGQARGVVLACAGAADMAVSEYSASQIKLGVVGNGRA